MSGSIFGVVAYSTTFAIGMAMVGGEVFTGLPGIGSVAVANLLGGGVMGGYMQPQGHAQVMVRLADYGQNPQAALDAPRYQVFEGRRVGIERGYDSEVYEQLRDRGHEVEIIEQKTVRYGGGQAIHVLGDGGYFGASDLRRDGQAVGF